MMFVSNFTFKTVQEAIVLYGRWSTEIYKSTTL